GARRRYGDGPTTDARFVFRVVLLVEQYGVQAFLVGRFSGGAAVALIGDFSEYHVVALDQDGQDRVVMRDYALVFLAPSGPRLIVVHVALRFGNGEFQAVALAQIAAIALHFPKSVQHKIEGRLFNVFFGLVFAPFSQGRQERLA